MFLGSQFYCIGVREDGEIDLMLRKNSRGSQEVQVHHEVQEVMDPDSDDRRQGVHI